MTRVLSSAPSSKFELMINSNFHNWLEQRSVDELIQQWKTNPLQRRRKRGQLGRLAATVAHGAEPVNSMIEGNVGPTHLGPASTRALVASLRVAKKTGAERSTQLVNSSLSKQIGTMFRVAVTSRNCNCISGGTLINICSRFCGS